MAPGDVLKMPPAEPPDKPKYRKTGEDGLASAAAPRLSPPRAGGCHLPPPVPFRGTHVVLLVLGLPAALSTTAAMCRKLSTINGFVAACVESPDSAAGAMTALVVVKTRAADTLASDLLHCCKACVRADDQGPAEVERIAAVMAASAPSPSSVEHGHPLPQVLLLRSVARLPGSPLKYRTMTAARTMRFGLSQRALPQQCRLPPLVWAAQVCARLLDVLEAWRLC